MSDPWDDLDHEDAKLTDEDKEFLESFDDYEDDREVLEALEDEDDFWELELDLEEYDDEPESV
jgi:hypothetical protein